MKARQARRGRKQVTGGGLAETNLDHLDRRLRGLDQALRLRGTEPGEPQGDGASGRGSVPRDVLRLRWHRDAAEGDGTG